ERDLVVHAAQRLARPDEQVLDRRHVGRPHADVELHGGDRARRLGRVGHERRDGGRDLGRIHGLTGLGAAGCGEREGRRGEDRTQDGAGRHRSSGRETPSCGKEARNPVRGSEKVTEGARVTSIPGAMFAYPPCASRPSTSDPTRSTWWWWIPSRRK